jgi:hypothetical protein
MPKVTSITFYDAGEKIAAGTPLDKLSERCRGAVELNQWFVEVDVPKPPKSAKVKASTEPAEPAADPTPASDDEPQTEPVTETEPAAEVEPATEPKPAKPTRRRKR